METLASNKVVQRSREETLPWAPSAPPIVSHARLLYHLERETSSPPVYGWTD